MTQAELAREIPVAEHTVSAWETGKRVPSHRNRVRLAQILGGDPGIYDEEVEVRAILVEVKAAEPERNGGPVNVDFTMRTWRDLAQEQALRREVEALLVILRAEDETIRDQLAWWMRERMFKVATDYLASEEPDMVALVTLRQELRLLGEYRVEVDGSDPWAENRAQWVDLLGRIVAWAQ
jgi:transcriptional regulator with XRE-family HTH domain